MRGEVRGAAVKAASCGSLSAAVSVWASARWLSGRPAAVAGLGASQGAVGFFFPVSSRHLAQIELPARATGVEHSPSCASSRMAASAVCLPCTTTVAWSTAVMI